MLPCWGICAGFLLLPLAALHFLVFYSQLWVWLFVPFSCSCPLIPVPCLLSVLPYAPPLASQKVFSDAFPFPSAGVGGLYSNKGRMGIDGIERQLQGLRLRHCCHGFDVKDPRPSWWNGFESLKMHKYHRYNTSGSIPQRSSNSCGGQTIIFAGSN